MIPQVMQALVILCALFVARASIIAACPHPCKCFIADNGIQAANCTNLPDQMKTTWPQTMLRIHFEGHHASPIMLKNKAFKHFPRLAYLDITGAKIQYVGNAAFDELPELVELNLVGTDIRKLHHNTFTTNQKLAFLSLKNNPRLLVGPSFLVSESITELDLSECALSSLKSVYFKRLPNLKYLFAVKNNLKILGSQFGPPGLKYVNLGFNKIEYINEDLETYKRLRTIDLTGNPINCTCELSEIDKKLIAKGVAFGNTVMCKNTGKLLSDMIEVCSDKEMMGDEPIDMYKVDNLLSIDKNMAQSIEEEIDDSGSGSGSGDGELILSNINPLVQNEIKNVTQNITEMYEKQNNINVDDLKNTTLDGVNVNIVTQIDDTLEEVIKNDTQIDDTLVEVVKNDTQIGGTLVEVVKNDTQIDDTLVEVVKNDTQIDGTLVDVIKNDTQINKTVVEEVMTKTNVNEIMAQPTSSEAPKIESTSIESLAANISFMEVTKEITTLPSIGDVIVHVQSPISTPGDNSSTVRSTIDRGIISETIQAPEDEQDVQAKVAEYLKSNAGITGTAVLLAIVIIAIVYKAVCLGKSRSHNTVTNDKAVELKEIKYVAADTDDSLHLHRDDSPTSSAEENLLEDHESDDDDDGDVLNEDDSQSLPAINNRAQNGMLNSVMDAIKNNGQPMTVPPKTPSPNGSPDVPTRVIVKLTETPKASKPITINNVH